MNFLPGHLYHVYNQGNNRDRIFFEKEDYFLFLKKMRKAFRSDCSLLAWCLMPNHFHWLLIINDDYNIDYHTTERTKKLNPLNKKIASLLSSYTQSINRKYGRSGSLFRKRTKAKSLNEQRFLHDNYLANCFFYIHQNPHKAGLVERIEHWEFSSFPDYCEIRNGNLCNINLALKLLELPKTVEGFYELSYKTIPEDSYKNIF
ncbi:transposase [Gracilimonas sp.]|uniref:transposase n=1 Tax=Gracilimonas sp. TaxID=1974203 RepID=UPI003D0B7E70